MALKLNADSEIESTSESSWSTLHEAIHSLSIEQDDLNHQEVSVIGVCCMLIPHAIHS